jgi:hypothetical protein
MAAFSTTMSAAAQVFVSHSSKDRLATEHLCALLAAPDDAEGACCDPLVDYTELQPGVEWPQYLHEMMAQCQAAIVLLTGNAVASPWVLKEATILTWRRSLDPQFAVFVAKDAAVVSDARLDQERFGPLMLPFVQQIATTDVAIVAAQVRARLKGLAQPDLSFESVLRPVRDLVSQVARVAPSTIMAVAQKLGVVEARWRPNVPPEEERVRSIATKLVCGRLGAYAAVDVLFAELAQTAPPAKVLEQLLGIVGPHWIEPDAAGRLPLVLSGGSRRAAVINGAYVQDFTATMFLRRAHPLSLLHSLIPTAGGSPGAIVDDVTAQICRYMRESEGATGSDDEIIADLAIGPAIRYVLLPPPPPDQSSLDALTARFPKLGFVISTGSALDREIDLDAIEWLLPPVDLEKERVERVHYRNAMKVVTRLARVG